MTALLIYYFIFVTFALVGGLLFYKIFDKFIDLFMGLIHLSDF